MEKSARPLQTREALPKAPPPVDFSGADTVPYDLSPVAKAWTKPTSPKEVDKKGVEGEGPGAPSETEDMFHNEAPPLRRSEQVIAKKRKDIEAHDEEGQWPDQEPKKRQRKARKPTSQKKKGKTQCKEKKVKGKKPQPKKKNQKKQPKAKKTCEEEKQEEGEETPVAPATEPSNEAAKAAKRKAKGKVKAQGMKAVKASEKAKKTDDKETAKGLKPPKAKAKAKAKSSSKKARTEDGKSVAASDQAENGDEPCDGKRSFARRNRPAKDVEAGRRWDAIRSVFIARLRCQLKKTSQMEAGWLDKNNFPNIY